MGEYIISATGTQHGLIVNSDGSINIGSLSNLTAVPSFDLGSPGFKQATIIASGTHTDVWVPGAGSKVEIHGFEMSSDTAQLAILQISGASTTTIAQFRLPNSGTVIKSFVHPITPGAGSQVIGVGTTVAGSIDVTVYGRDKV